MKKKNKQQYQIVYITLSDGSTGAFTGPVLAKPRDEGEKHIVKLEFSEPKNLPDDMSFEHLLK